MRVTEFCSWETHIDVLPQFIIFPFHMSYIYLYFRNSLIYIYYYKNLQRSLAKFTMLLSKIKRAQVHSSALLENVVKLKRKRRKYTLSAIGSMNFASNSKQISQSHQAHFPTLICRLQRVFQDRGWSEYRSVSFIKRVTQRYFVYYIHQHRGVCARQITDM